jgi:heparin binding hemagglutinin HbhA
MAVELPTTAEVRKARHQVAKSAAERAGAARTPLLAVLGAGDLAVAAVSKAVTEARARAVEARAKATEQAGEVQTRVVGLPQRLNSEELRKAVADLRVQAEQAYNGFAERGADTWGRIRRQPQVKEALERFENYTEKLDARVDDLVDDARDAAEKALAVVSTQTRSTGERFARATQRFSGQAAETVAEAGSDAAEAISEAGDEVAHETRSTTRKAAGRTAPKPAEPTSAETTSAQTTTETTPAAKPAARKPATRRSTNGSQSGS